MDNHYHIIVLYKDRKAAIKKYRELTSEKADKEYESVKVIGDEAYQIMCMSRNKNEARNRLDEILIDTGIGTEDYYLQDMFIAIQLKRGL